MNKRSNAAEAFLLALVLLASMLMVRTAYSSTSPTFTTELSTTFLTAPSNSIEYGHSELITVNGILKNDLVEIKVNNVLQAGPLETKVTYNTDNLKPGSYFIVGDDTTAKVAANETIIVNNDPVISIMPTNAVLDSGQIETYKISVYEGAGPYVAGLYNYSDKQTLSNTYLNKSANTIELSFKVSSTKSKEKFTYRGAGVDEGVIPYYDFNSLSNEITVNPAINNSVLKVSNTIPLQNQSITLTEHFYGGTPSFSAKFAATYNGNVIFSKTVSSNSNTITTSFKVPANALGKISVNAIVTDNASTPATMEDSNSIVAYQSIHAANAPRLAAPSSSTIVSVVSNSAITAHAGSNPVQNPIESLSFQDDAVIALVAIVALLAIFAEYRSKSRRQRSKQAKR